MIFEEDKYYVIQISDNQPYQLMKGSKVDDLSKVEKYAGPYDDKESGGMALLFWEHNRNYRNYVYSVVTEENGWKPVDYSE